MLERGVDKRLEIEEDADVVIISKLVWCNHLVASAHDRNMTIVLNAGIGRPKKRWNEVVHLTICGLDKDLEKDRE